MVKKNVVLLVDNKTRDLLAATLIAHHLDRLGIVCHLGPLGAYQGVLAAYRPDMIIFNHLTARHLVAYSKRLAAMGVLTTVLTNEGITYEKQLLKFIVGSHHSDAHIDYFFGWNNEMREAMRELGMATKTDVKVIGIPRFDLYCPPWNRMFADSVPRSKPAVLVCTNFAYAEYYGLPPEKSARIFAAVKSVNPIFEDYQKAIDVHHENRLRIFPFLDELVKARKWKLIVRPHPYEKMDLYRAWYDKLPADIQQDVVLDKDTNITRLILNSDLQISCETCTTAMEAWIARKPTIELVFQRYPVYFHQEHADLNPLCERSQEIVSLVANELAHPEQERFSQGREAHLRKWCHTPDGTSCAQVARLIAEAVNRKKPADWSMLEPADHRRAWKLKAMHSIGHAYNYNPLLAFKYLLFPKKYEVKKFTYAKSVKPGDVTAMRLRLEESLKKGAFVETI